MNVDRFETSLLECGSHFEFAVDALFAENCHLRTACEILHNLGGRRHVEGHLRRDTRIVLFQLERVFTFGTIRVIAEGRDAAGRVAPNSAEIREAFGVVADDQVISIVERTNFRNGIAETSSFERSLHSSEVSLLHLKHGTEFFVEQGVDQVTLEGGSVERYTHVASECHFGNRRVEAAIALVVVGHNLASGIELLDGFEEGAEFLSGIDIRSLVAEVVVNLSGNGCAHAVLTAGQVNEHESRILILQELRGKRLAHVGTRSKGTDDE